MAKTTIGVILSLLAIFVMPSCSGDTASSTSGGASSTGGGSFQLMEATIDDVHAAYRSGQLTARQLVQQYLDRIEAFDQDGPAINCIITLNPTALEEADKLDEQYRRSGPVGPLHGIPVVVKDQVDVAGTPTTLGSLVFKDYRPPQDAFVVARVKAAGGIILAKTTLGEFGGGDTYGSIFGATRNPYDPDRTVGGSSGGSAACLSANFATLAIGQEGFASIRRPATWNAVVGMRPTTGLTSRTGVYGGHPSPVGLLGPLARTVTDLAKLLDVMVGYDREDPVTALGVGHVPESYTQALDRNGLQGARIGIIRDAFGTRSDPESEDFKKVDAVFQQALAELKAAGAELVDPVVIPDLKELLAKRTENPLSQAGLEIWLARNPSSPYKTRADIQKSPDVGKIIPPSKSANWTRDPGPPDLVAYAEYVLARDQLMMNVMQLMADNRLDAIVHKSVEHQPNLIRDGMNPPYANNSGVAGLNTLLLYAASMTVPAGFTSDGLPTGITFFGRAYSEPLLLKFAYAYEQATHHRLPPKTTPALPEVEER